MPAVCSLTALCIRLEYKRLRIQANNRLSSPPDIRYKELDRKAKRLGCRFHAPFITLSFMALPVIPSLKLTDIRLVDVDNFCFTEVLYGQSPAGTEPCGACR
ncbi:MAG TPA: hypothetical protein IAB87_07500 [Candidatus Coprenecus merdipullorum]|nr:hypothetical protein [Candidatus Coprenecus merdipullorum]